MSFRTERPLMIMPRSGFLLPGLFSPVLPPEAGVLGKARICVGGPGLPGGCPTVLRVMLTH